MVKLTAEQLKELDQVSGQEMTLIDPRSSIQYVLVPRSEYERQLLAIVEEKDLGCFIASATRHNVQSLDQEEAEHGQAW